MVSYGTASLTVRDVYITSAAITFNADVAFTRYSAIELAIPAAVGDSVELEVGGMWQPAGSDFIDWAVVSGTTMVRFCSSGTGTPCVEGDPGWYPSATFAKGAGKFRFTVVSGDLDTGTVRFTLAHKGAAGGTLYSNANYPLRMTATNYHTVT